MWLLIAFIAIPLIEIALFIQVGGLIGLWPTLLIVVLTAVIGTSMLRRQGVMALAGLQKSFQNLNDPTEPLAHGAMILFSGALLLTPGFFTDTLGFALLVPAVRSFVFKELRKRVKVRTFSTGPAPQPEGDIIDGEFQDLDPAKRPTHQPSGWTKH